ncbi:acetyl-CoA acetyltransferase [Novosphingobium sp. PhB165]|uniref:thiolase family protein n=1 Tax=Novosphingobium sp. PhB165 TaxID=2485105 RepID=UPI00104FD220|nr:thiolase family protein [Novosphingobium sp. PhB165]TCM20476.1 acetyl-CoA acetyltransferase [Novosphingobium sp. PhB165]
MARNPLRDRVAIVGIGSSPYGRDLQRSELSLGLEAAVNAIADAGIDRQEIDGICGSGMTSLAMGNAGFLSLQGALGIERCTWGKNGWLGSALVYTVEAVFSGLCDMALLVQANVRSPGMSRAAARDPFRARAAQFAGIGGDVGLGDFAKRWIHSGEPYAAIMRRYCHDFGVNKDAFAMLAVNTRSYGALNPEAVFQSPLSLEDYHASRMVWDPMQVADMDVPCDCAEALVITTAERARDLNVKPVFVHAMALGGTRIGEYYENFAGWRDNSFQVSMSGLWDRSELRLPDIDLFYPYDGYTMDAIAITEAAGYCGIGEATDYFRTSWDSSRNILMLDGRVPVLTDGGGLAHGRAGGANLYAEAARQLRGNLGNRQVPGAQSALIGIGSFFHDPAAVILRA